MRAIKTIRAESRRHREDEFTPATSAGIRTYTNISPSSRAYRRRSKMLKAFQ